MGFFTEDEMDSGLPEYLGADAWESDVGRSRDPNDTRRPIQRLKDQIAQRKMNQQDTPAVRFDFTEHRFNADEWSADELGYYQCLQAHLRNQKYNDVDPHGHPDALYLYHESQWQAGELDFYRQLPRKVEI